MNTPPLFEEKTNVITAAMMRDAAVDPLLSEQFETGSFSSQHRCLSVYPAIAGFDLAQELEFLSWRSIEANVFFNARFMAPAMTRLDDKNIRFAVLRDEGSDKKRSRFLMPFSIEKVGFGLGYSVIRSWSTPYSPLGTPLIDRDAPVSVVEDVLEIMSRKHLKLPDVLIIPDIAINGAAASIIKTAALSRNLCLLTTNSIERPILRKTTESETVLKHYQQKYARMMRRLGEQGVVTFSEFRNPLDIRQASEEFLILEATSWKGRQRSAMMSDRYRAAFAREALLNLAERDMCHIHTLDIDGKTIASMVVFRDVNTAYTWKITHSEDYSKWSPGVLLTLEVTKKLLQNANIERTDSLSEEDHPVLSRLWTDRETMGTLVIGLTPGSDRAARHAANQLEIYNKSKKIARSIRDRILNFKR
jgi:CelD/BcsL family acetyltransferase involved in cellulose biosynthesis